MKQKINSWRDITVGQFMDLQTLAKREADSDNQYEKAENAISIFYGLTPKEIDELPTSEFNFLSKRCAEIMKMPLDDKPQKVITVNGKRYEIIYDPKQLRHRQFVEIQHFVSNGMFENIHNILASIVMPIGRFGKRIKNTAELHDEISNDMLDAKITDVYNSCVFFCKLYLNSLLHIRGYLVHKMMIQGATKEQAMELVNSSINAMAGSITQKNWQLLKI